MFSGGGLVSERACERSVLDDAASAATSPRPENPPRANHPERTAGAPDLNADTLHDGTRPTVTARGGSVERQTVVAGDAVARRCSREEPARRAVRPSVRADPEAAGFPGGGMWPLKRHRQSACCAALNCPPPEKHGTRSDEDDRAVLAPLSLGG